MPTTIKLKNGSGAPTAGDLVQGEPALDLTNKRLYTEDAGGNVIEVGTSPSTIDINAGSIDGVTLGTNSAVTSAVITTADINGGTIDDTTIGGSTPAAGSFTTITGSGDMNIDSGTLFVDASTNRVGIGTSSPSSYDSSFNQLVVADASASAGITIATPNTTYGRIAFADGTTGNEQYRGSITYNHSDDGMRFSTAATERMRIDSSGDIFIGSYQSSSSADNKFYYIKTAPYNWGGSTTDEITAIGMGASGTGQDDGVITFSTTTNANAGGTLTERMRIDGDGNLLVGRTAAPANSNDGTGVYMNPLAFIEIARTSGAPLILNRRTSDGDSILFRKDGVAVGSIGTYFDGSSRYFYIAGGSPQECGIGFYANGIYPSTATGSVADNSKDLGSSNARWDDVYATNGTIQTSDRNEKQDIEELSEAEQRVAVAAKGLLRKFRWKSAVEKKSDDARIHFGIIAQDLQAAFEAEGLDAGRYAMFIYSEWWETYTDVPAVEAVDAVYETVTDEEGNETQVLVSEAVEAKDAYVRTDTYDTEEEAPEGAVKKSRMGVRYSELLAFIIAAI